MNTLMFVDDDKEMLEIMAASFKDKGFDVYTATSAKKALSLLKKIKPNCITLDVMMPEIDGFKAFGEIKKLCSAPIIFVTGKVAEDDKVKGLLMGADDYIEKPFGLKELHARIVTAIRKNSPITSTLYCPPLEINVINKTVLCNGEKIGLTSREFEILYFLASSSGEVVSYEKIGTHIWGGYLPSDRASVMVNVSRLRKKLEVNLVAAKMIETVWSEGYKFNQG